MQGFWIGAENDWLDLSDLVETVTQEWLINTSASVPELGETLRLGYYYTPALLLRMSGWVDGTTLQHLRGRIAQILSRGHRTSETRREVQMVRLSDDTDFRRAICELTAFSLPSWEHALVPTRFEGTLLCGIPRAPAVQVSLNVPTSHNTWVTTNIPDDDAELWSETEFRVKVNANVNLDIEFRAYAVQGRGTQTIRVAGSLSSGEELIVSGGIEDTLPVIRVNDASRWQYLKGGWFPTMRAGSGRSVAVKVWSGTLSSIQYIKLRFDRRYYQL